jgi:hypothetical protein
MYIVAAGMHYAGVSGFVGYLVGLHNGQRIHIGPQGYRSRIRVLAPDQGDYAGARNAFLWLQPQRTQLFGYVPGSIVFLKGQFRIGVQVPARKDYVFGVLTGK